jgi:hypothetical protein
MCIFQVESDLLGDVGHLWQCFMQQRRLVTIAWGGNQRCNNIAVAIADSDNFIALKVFVPAESQIITAFLRRCRCPIPMKNADVEELFLVKMRHGTRDDSIEAPLGCLKAPKDAINVSVVGDPAPHLGQS